MQKRRVQEGQVVIGIMSLSQVRDIADIRVVAGQASIETKKIRFTLQS